MNTSAAAALVGARLLRAIGRDAVAQYVSKGKALVVMDPPMGTLQPAETIKVTTDCLLTAH